MHKKYQTPKSLRLRLSDHNSLIEEEEEKDPCFQEMKDYVTHVTNSRIKFIF